MESADKTSVLQFVQNVKKNWIPVLYMKFNMEITCTKKKNNDKMDKKKVKMGFFLFFNGISKIYLTHCYKKVISVC